MLGHPVYTNNDQDLVTKDAIFHQSIEKFYKLIPRDQLPDEVLQKYPHLQLYLEDRTAYNDMHGHENRIYGSKMCFKEQLVWNLLHNSVDNENVGFFFFSNLKTVGRRKGTKHLVVYHFLTILSMLRHQKRSTLSLKLKKMEQMRMVW